MQKSAHTWCLEISMCACVHACIHVCVCELIYVASYTHALNKFLKKKWNPNQKHPDCKNIAAKNKNGQAEKDVKSEGMDGQDLLLLMEFKFWWPFCN